MGVVCMNAVKLGRDFPQIVCRKRFKGGKQPVTTMEKAECCCAHQYLCPKSGEWELTSGANSCPVRGGEAK